LIRLATQSCSWSCAYAFVRGKDLSCGGQDRRGGQLRSGGLGPLPGATAVWPLPARAQQAAKTRLIGYLDYGGGAPFHDVYRRRPFLEGLRERGWVEGQNVTIERRFAAGQADRLPALAAELVTLNVEVILAAATRAAKAAQKATSRISIVMADPGDAVRR